VQVLFRGKSEEEFEMLADAKWKRAFDYHAQMRANYNNGYKEAETKYQEEIRELRRRLAEK
jgi:hypothetical protein